MNIRNAKLVLQIFKKLIRMLIESLFCCMYHFVPYNMRHMKDLSTEVVLLTGSGQGLGRQLAARLAGQRCKLILWDDDQRQLDGTLQLVKGINHDVRGYKVDVSDRHAVYETAVRVKREFGPVSLLINCTDAVNGMKFMELDDEMIVKNFNTNALSQVWVIKAFLPDMMEMGRGHLVSVPCMSGLIGSSHLTDYTAAKHAVVGLIESLRLELKSERFNEILTTLVFPYSTNNKVLKGLYNGLMARMDDGHLADEVLSAVRREVRVHYTPDLLSFVLMFKVFVTARAILAVQRVLNGKSADITKRNVKEVKCEDSVLKNMH